MAGFSWFQEYGGRRILRAVYIGRSNVMKKIIYLLIAWSAMAAVGCNSVYTPRPMGAAPFPLVKSEWEGNWLYDDGFLVIRVLDESEGILQIASIEDEGGLKLETQDVYMRETGSSLFASWKEDSSYIWIKVKKDGEKITAWIPDANKFKTLVREGKLPGRIVDNGDVYLDDLAPKHVEIITTETEGVLFDWQNPSIAMRLPERHSGSASPPPPTGR
jgi:hypothetical protein